VESGRRRTLVEDDEVTRMTFLASGALLALGTRGGLVRLRDLAADGSWALSGHRGPIVALAGAADGRTLSSAGDDGTVRRWPNPVPAAPAALRGWLEGATRVVIGDYELR
jgi:hypothetical protein